MPSHIITKLSPEEYRSLLQAQSSVMACTNIFLMQVSMSPIIRENPRLREITQLCSDDLNTLRKELLDFES